MKDTAKSRAPGTGTLTPPVLPLAGVTAGAPFGCVSFSVEKHCCLQQNITSCRMTRSNSIGQMSLFSTSPCLSAHPAGEGSALREEVILYFYVSGFKEIQSGFKVSLSS